MNDVAKVKRRACCWPRPITDFCQTRQRALQRCWRPVLKAANKNKMSDRRERRLTRDCHSAGGKFTQGVGIKSPGKCDTGCSIDDVSVEP